LIKSLTTIYAAKKNKAETININHISPIIFNSLYIENKDSITENYTYINYLDNNLLSLINQIQVDSRKKEEIIKRNLGQSKPCDIIFIEYLEYVCQESNLEYFKFIFKIILLFRECINKYKNIEMHNRKSILNEEIPENIKEYTQHYNSDQIPELCNEFLTDFMESSNYYGMNTLEEREEIITIVHHFCYWLFKNYYTSSKLTLLV